MRRACLAHYQWPRALRDRRRGHWMDCRNSNRDTAASPLALRRIMVWWRCNRGRSSLCYLTLAPARKDAPGETLGCPTGTMPVLRSFLEFIACGCGIVFSFRHDTNFFFFVKDERMRWNAFCQENVRADSGIRANHGVTAHDRGSGVNANAVFNRRMTLFPAQSLSRPERARDERHALVKFHVRSDLRCLANDDAGAVVDEKMRTNLRARMNIDPGAAVRPLGHNSRNQRHFSVEQMCHSINRDRLQRRIRENNFLVTSRGRIAFVGSVDVRPEHAAHRGQPLEKITQDFFGFCFCWFIRRNFAKASANFCSESRVQMSHANARSVG